MHVCVQVAHTLNVKGFLECQLVLTFLLSELFSKHVLALQGTDQQRYAAAALQKLDWYYTPQTRRWYKAVKTPVIDSARKVYLI